MRLKSSRTSIFVRPCQFLARANSPEEAISQDPHERQEKECSINDGEKPRESPQASGNPEAGITATSSVPPAGGVNRAAYELNVPLRAMHMSAAPQAGNPAERTLLSVDSPNVVIEAVKKAEEGQDIVVRLYEAAGQRCEARLRIGFEHGSVFLTNLLEEQAQPLPANADAVRIPFHPFEIQTVRIALGAQGANPRIIFEEWDRVQKEAGALSRGPNQKPWQPAGWS